MEDEDKTRWNEAHRLATKHHRILFELPDGSDKDDVPLVTWLFRIVSWYKRRAWFWRLMVVQIPLTLGAVATLYGATVGVIEATTWLMERIK